MDNSINAEAIRQERAQQRLLQRLALPPVDVNSRYTVEEALALLRTSRATLYARIAAKEIALIREGRRTYIPGSEIARLSRVPQ
jgi:excisionase family DNA binding protein